MSAGEQNRPLTRLHRKEMKMIPDGTGRLLIAFSLVLALLAPAGADAQDVIVDPGYITGTVTTTLQEHSVYSLSVSASGGGNSASKNVNGNTYDLTVQGADPSVPGGDFDYSVSTTAYVRPDGATSPYTRVYFNPRIFQVLANTTVVNDYAIDGAFLFDLNITGDTYNSWSINTYANVNPTAGETTNSQGSTSSSVSPNGTWYMVAVPNQQVRVYAQLRINGTAWDEATQRFYNYSKRYTLGSYYYDLAAGQIVTAPLEVEHVTPPAPPIVTYDYGSLSGSVYLDLNVDGVDYSDKLNPSTNHNVFGRSINTNPGSYFRENIRTGTYTVIPRSNFTNDGQSFSFTWPYINGDYLNNRVIIEKDLTTFKDFAEAAGILEGTFAFTGIFKNADLAYRRLNVSGPYRFYDPVEGWVIQKTYQGRVNGFTLNQGNSPDGRYRLFLTDGPWVSPSISARAQYNDVGYYRYSDLSINDYNYQYDGGSTYNFGQPAYVTAGTTAQMDREYCTGSVVVRLRRSDGGLLSSPRVSGSANIYNAAGKREMAISVSGWASVSNHPAPGVEVFGPPATYNLTAQATTADGSRITLVSFPFDLECNVRKEKDILGPDLQVTSPEAELVTDASSVLVTGTAIDDTGMQLVTVNEVVVSQDPSYPNTVNFSYDLPLVDGENTITTVALDVEGKESSDERTVYRDPWLPTVSILSPATGSLQPKDGYVPVQVDAADQGFGYIVKIYLDNTLVSETEGPVRATAPAGIIVDALAGPLAAGAHTIRADVVDRAGHTATDTVTITTDLWSPTISIVAPPAGSIFSGNETITVMTQATDRGIGFTLDTSLDGASIGEVIGPADAATPAMATFTGTVGPLAGGTHTLSATAADSGGNSVTAQRTFQVDAWAPTVSITAPPDRTILANSPTPFAVQAKASDLGYGFTLVVFVDGVSIGDVSGPGDDNAAAEVIFDGTVGPLAHGEHTISATATDVVGNTATTSVTVYADTEAPTVSITLPTDGGIYTQVVEVPVDVTATDQGYGFTLRVSLGTTLLYEGNGPVDPVAAASLNSSFSIPPLAPDDYVLSAEVTDRAGNTATASASFTVPPNSPPTVDAGGSYTTDEGISITLTATGSDPENGLLTYAWDLNNDGTFETPGQSVSFTGTDGPSGHTVAVEVTDDGGLTATDTITVTVNNVAPVVDAGPDITVNEGDAFSGNGSFYDPGTDAWSATVDYGDGSGPQPLSLAGMSFNLSHTYTDNGVHILTVAITDDDDGTHSDQVQVIVNNVAPTVNAGPEATINEGGTFTGGGSFSDPGVDTWTATVNYGDGSGPQPLSLAGMSFNLSHSYADNGVHTVTVTVTDDDGGVDSDQVQVIVYNVTPTVNTGPDATINEGGIFTGGGSFYDPGFDIWTATVDYGDGSGPQPLTLTGTAFALSHTYSDSNVRKVTVTITDDDGGLGSDQVQVTVNNVAPMADFSNITGSIVEGDSATATFNNPSDPSPADIAAGFLYSYDCESDGVFEAVDIAADSYTCAYPDNGLFSVLGRIMDQDGGATDYTAEVSVSNAAPVVGQITAPTDSVAVNIAVSASADFSDAGVLDTHTAEWAWGDGTTSAGVVTETGGSGSVTGSHAYNVPGVYTLVLTVTDKDGHTGQSVFEYVVVYDPTVGFVTGGGWIDSPAGAYPADPTLTGKANFGFVSKYKKGTTKPTGNTQFNYHAGDLKFHSTDYQWLVVAGPHAKFKGSGTINGSGDYGFMVNATDGQRNGGGGVDRLRMKIWVKSTGALVYDNQIGDADDSNASDAIEGGSVVIH